MPKAKLLDIVRLTTPKPEYGLEAGVTGTIVHEFETIEEAYEVEFATEGGETIVECSLTSSEFEVVVPWGAVAARPVGRSIGG